MSGFSMVLFRALLLLFPPAFRRRHGEEMADLFRARLQRAGARGPVAVVRTWWWMVWDMMSSAAGERLAGEGGATWEGGMGSFVDDVRYATRRLLRAPLFSAAVVAILAVGIGANTAAFTVVDAVLFRPPPFERPEEIVTIFQDSDDGEPSSSAYPAYRDIAERGDVFAGVAATSADQAIWDRGEGARPASVVYTTSSYFPVLGLTPSRGVWFEAEHDYVGAGAFAVVTHRTWRSEMGADPGVIGSAIRLNGQPVTVIGVGPEDFNGPGGALVHDFWLSISSTPIGGAFRVTNLDRREDHWYDVVARLAPGVTVARARGAMDALALRMGELNPELDRNRGLTVFELGEVRFHPQVDRMLFSVGVAVLAVVGLVLLLACSNLANLLLVRGVARAPEMALRLALGAARGRVVRLFLIEAALLSVLGAGIGVLIARWGAALLAGLPIPLPDGLALDVSVDARVLLFTTVLALATGVFFGLLPALQASSVAVAGTLREDTRSASPGRRASLLRNVLVGVQVGVSLVLLVGTGLLTRSLANVRGVDPGIDAERIAVIGINPTQAGVSNADAPALMEALAERVRVLPGVESAAMTSRLPVQPGGSTTTVIEGYVPVAGTDAVEMPFAYVSPSYFETVGVRLLAGRGFGPQDRPGTARVVLVSETAANRFWGGDAVGKRLRPQGAPDAWREVVGVVSDARVSSLNETPTPMMYFSMDQVPVGCCFVLARTQGDPDALTAGLRAALQEVAPNVSATRLAAFESLLGESLSAPRAAAAATGVFSLLALVLATLGIYSVVSFTVARRAAELGIRVALGAARGGVVRMVLRESLATVVVGIVAGLGVALAVAPGLEGVLFQVGAADPATFIGAGALLLVVAVAASGVPAWRATRANPVEVLRAQ